MVISFFLKKIPLTAKDLKKIQMIRIPELPLPIAQPHKTSICETCK